MRLDFDSAATATAAPPATSHRAPSTTAARGLAGGAAPLTGWQLAHAPPPPPRVLPLLLSSASASSDAGGPFPEPQLHQAAPPFAGGPFQLQLPLSGPASPLAHAAALAPATR